MSQQEHSIAISHASLTLTASLHLPEPAQGKEGSDSGFPLVVICHGFIGSRIGVNRLFVRAARQMAENGYAVLRFDYAGCGESTGSYGAEGLRSMVQQTKTVLDYARTIPQVDPKRISLLGHSLGGATAVLTASKDPRIQELILWAPVAHPYQDIADIVGKPLVQQALQQGTADYLSYTLHDIFFTSLQQEQPLFACQQVDGDVLILHGSADEVISTDYCFLYDKMMKQRQRGTVEKEVIFGADHTFSQLAHQDLLIERTSQWLKDRVKKAADWNHWTI
ncbi:alpha/beta hydrolase family protein [Marinicrinis lubricantis]|uniref:Alpha/beta hydrolase family protein n=1 Tax=Marinicrinis lubricantis TaxID=2086470 RepID=A0ABW1IUB7_9BACL